MGTYRARWGRTGHGEEVQDTLEKYSARWRSKAHNEKGEQGKVGKYNARWGRTDHGGEVQDTVGNSRVR